MIIQKRGSSMKIGYEILWTENALNELEKTISYLKENWTEKEIRKLALAVEKTVLLLTKNPLLFPESDIKKDIRRVVVLAHNTLYYRIIEQRIEILSFFLNSQNPKKLKLK